MKNRIVKIWELQATCQKSFYRKAYVFQDERGNLYLQSYCSMYDELKEME